MGALLDTLGRSHGELIRADDWNGLIEAVERIENGLTQRIDSLSTSVDARFGAVEEGALEIRQKLAEMAERLEGAEEVIITLKKSIDQVRHSLRRVTMRTERLNYAIGEHSEIVAQITGIDGEPLQLGSTADRPWIDFVTVWGKLEAAPGFTSAGGTGDRALSVQVDAQGIARARLRAEHAEGLTSEVEAEVAAALRTRLPTKSRSLIELILEAQTPREAQENGVFRFISDEYQRKDARSIQKYLDRYYLSNPDTLAETKVATYFHRWRDYRSTVLAFAKSDGDPRTPDANLGACSIQVTFRDWINPWIHLEFFAETPKLAEHFRGIFGGLVVSDYNSTVKGMQERIDLSIDGLGSIGKQRTYRAIADALANVRVADPPPHLKEVVTTLRSGVQLQAGLEYGQAVGLGAAEHAVAVNAFAGTGQLINEMSARVQSTVQQQVEERLATTATQLESTVRQEQANFVDTFFAEGNNFKLMQQQVQMLAGEVSGVKTAVSQKADMKLVTRFLEIG